MALISFIFEVIIDRYVLSATLFFFNYYFYSSFDSFFLLLSSLGTWWLSLVLCFESFLSVHVCIFIGFWFVVTLHLIYNSLHVCVCARICVCVWDYFKLLISEIQMHSNNPRFLLPPSHCLLFLMSYFTSSRVWSLSYLLWILMIFLLLSFNLPISFISDWSAIFFSIFAFTNENFVLILIFLFVAFYFTLRNPLFLVRLVSQYWTLLAFACLQNFCSLHQISIKALPGRVFLVVGFSLSSI